jgi:shikimate 5-dehydrogenase
MYPHVTDSPVPASSLTGELVYDLVYNPERTQLLQDAAARGCRTIGGLDMLVAQAGAQFFWWTGIQPPLDVMRDAARRRLLEFRTDENHLV